MRIGADRPGLDRDGSTWIGSGRTGAYWTGGDSRIRSPYPDLVVASPRSSDPAVSSPSGLEDRLPARRTDRCRAAQAPRRRPAGSVDPDRIGADRPGSDWIGSDRSGKRVGAQPRRRGVRCPGVGRWVTGLRGESPRRQSWDASDDPDNYSGSYRLRRRVRAKDTHAAVAGGESRCLGRGPYRQAHTPPVPDERGTSRRRDTVRDRGPPRRQP
jgi:hypothetical protein